MNKPTTILLSLFWFVHLIMIITIKPVAPSTIFFWPVIILNMLIIFLIIGNYWSERIQKRIGFLKGIMKGFELKEKLDNEFEKLKKSMEDEEKKNVSKKRRTRTKKRNVN